MASYIERVVANIIANKYGINPDLAGADVLIRRIIREEIYEMDDKVIKYQFHRMGFDVANETVDKRTAEGKANKKAYSKETHNYFEKEAAKRDRIRDYHYDIKNDTINLKTDEELARMWKDMYDFSEDHGAVYSNNVLLGYEESAAKRKADNDAIKTRILKSSLPLEVRRYIEQSDAETAREYVEWLDDLKNRMAGVDFDSTGEESMQSIMDKIIEGGYKSTRKAKNMLANFIRYQISKRGISEAQTLINKAYTIKAGGRTVFGVREKQEFSEYVKADYKYK